MHDREVAQDVTLRSPYPPVFSRAAAWRRFCLPLDMACASHRRRLLGLFGSLLGVSALGCGATTVRDGFDASYCTGEQPDLVIGLQPTEATDYVALHVTYGEGSASTVVQADGTACPGQSAQCLGAVDAGVDGGIRAGGGQTGAIYLHLTTTLNDEVKVLLTIDEVKAFLGTIDTPSEAALLVALAGYSSNCSSNNYSKVTGGYLVYAEEGQTCGDDVRGHQVFVSTEGNIDVRFTEVVVEGNDGCAIGRLPSGLCGLQRFQGHDVGAFYARVAQLEGASVAAFEQLTRELRHHNASQDLIDYAEAAVRQEKRHAILTSALARKYGRQPEPPLVQPTSVRSLEAIALDNAVEGLVRETFGALVAHHQASHAADPLMREIARVIADDETAHAGFSWALHEWLLSRLDEEGQARVERARRAAVVSFAPDLCAPVSAEVVRLAGMPSEDSARSLYAGLTQALWSS